MPPPGGLPDSFLEPVDEPMAALVRRYASTHGPFPTRQLADRYGVDPIPALRELEASGALVRGELLPGGSEREWCDADVLRRVRRASLARLRKEVEAADRTELARFLPSWQNVDVHGRTGAGTDRLREALVPLQGVALTPKTWERDVLPRRLGAYSPAWLDELCTSGELVWLGPARWAAATARSRSTSVRTSASQVRRPATPSSTRPRVRSTMRSATASAKGRASGSTCWTWTAPRRSCTRPSGTWPGRAR